MGLLTCDMSGHTHPDVKHPFLIIEARTLQQAEDTYNSLVPLTNRKYSMPYIDDISDAVVRKMGGGNVVNNYYVNDAVVNDDPAIQAAFLGLFDVLMRKGAMNVG